MVKQYLLLACVLAACTSNATPADAPATVHDAPAALHDGASPDGAAATCTGALYDPCTGPAAGCMSNNCRAFGTSGFSVCTQTCSGANPCPAQGGVAVTCTGMGFCKPNAPNACTP